MPPQSRKILRTWLAFHASGFRNGGNTTSLKKPVWEAHKSSRVTIQSPFKISRLCGVDYCKAYLQYLPRLKEQLCYEFSQLIEVTGYLIEQKNSFKNREKSLWVLSRDPSAIGVRKVLAVKVATA